MILVHQEVDVEFDINENQVDVIVIENQEVYSKFMQDIWNQVNGEDGGFILSETGKIKNIAKETECIFNPFCINCNDKKILNKLYQEMREISDEYFQEDILSVNSQLVDYLDKLSVKVPYAVTFNPELSVSNILKLYDVRLDTMGESILEKMIEYLNVMNKLCNIKTFFFVGVRQYFTDDDVKKIYEFAFYEKINLITFECMQRNKISGEKCWIIDKDRCIIELN